jgi:putative NADH-flavin reductase
MQTILGANGIIGEELARELRKNYTDKTISSRNPQSASIRPSFKADLLDQESVIKSLNNTDCILDSRTSVRF